MIKFIKDNFNMVWKFFLNHVAMAMFALVVHIAGKMLNEAVYYAAGALSILLYLFLLYSMLIDKGSEDKIKIDGGRMKKNNCYGLYVALIANSINILLCVITLVTSFFIGEGTVVINTVHSVFKLIVNYYNAMYLSITNLTPTFPAIYLISVIPSLIVCMLSYIAGINGYKHFIPESKKVDRERRR